MIFTFFKCLPTAPVHRQRADWGLIFDFKLSLNESWGNLIRRRRQLLCSPPSSGGRPWGDVGGISAQTCSSGLICLDPCRICDGFRIYFAPFGLTPIIEIHSREASSILKYMIHFCGLFMISVCISCSCVAPASPVSASASGEDLRLQLIWRPIWH